MITSILCGFLNCKAFFLTSISEVAQEPGGLNLYLQLLFLSFKARIKVCANAGTDSN